jgi:hypothetical protein
MRSQKGLRLRIDWHYKVSLESHVSRIFVVSLDLHMKLSRTTLTALLVILATVAAGVAGPIEDAGAAHERGEYATALRLLRPLADHGVAEAQRELGFMYYNGEGVPQNYAEAVKWYRLAADQGLTGAQHDLGVMYLKGQGVPQDYVLAHNGST